MPSKRERAQDGSFAVVGKREERAYEIENRKRLRKREDMVLREEAENE